jgi:hypothetical protein
VWGEGERKGGKEGGERGAREGERGKRRGGSEKGGWKIESKSSHAQRIAALAGTEGQGKQGGRQAPRPQPAARQAWRLGRFLSSCPCTLDARR